MTVQEKIVLTPENVEDFLRENFNSLEFESTMSKEERRRVVERATERYDANDDDAGDEIMGELPLEPREALRFLTSPLLGLDFISTGYNLVDVEKAFGPDWLEKFEVRYV